MSSDRTRYTAISCTIAGTTKDTMMSLNFRIFKSNCFKQGHQSEENKRSMINNESEITERTCD